MRSTDFGVWLPAAGARPEWREPLARICETAFRSRADGCLRIARASHGCDDEHVSAGEILDQIKDMPVEEWLEIQSGIGQMLASTFSQDDVKQIAEALREADDDAANGRVSSSDALRRHFGLR